MVSSFNHLSSLVNFANTCGTSSHIMSRIYPPANNQTTGSNGPKGLEEFIASHQSKRLKRSKQGSPTGGSFQEDVSQTASSSLQTGAKDLPP